ncbi:hypothetical protein SteCoe_18776 [Stentor coeruleus]|uniref:Uncharacterized protein n=1 Tax=Stentor coeruleus TaxID=5963 RepID=A0A1R2BVN4_9CILI|nr:hypothetical protein SteCoe_18776 [Stentor coeruleus]
MRKSWSAKGFTNRSRPFLSQTRQKITQVSVSTQRLKPYLSIELSTSTPRPTTSGSLWLSSRSNLLQSPVNEIPGLNTEDAKKIYQAKCKDLDILYNKDQELRFLNFCGKSFADRSMGLNENGLGIESIKVISRILLKNSYFCRLNLSKNSIGEQGLYYLARVLKKNTSIVSVDISSNDIGIEGSSQFFDILRDNESIVSISIASLEGLHRNRLGILGADSISNYLRYNKVLTHLNISDTSIGKEGFEHIIQGLAHNKTLVSLDISNNGFSYHSLDDFCSSLITTNLKELNLSGNKIGNKGSEIFAKLLASRLVKTSPLVKIDLSSCDITSLGAFKIFESLENNACVISLKFDNNDIGISTGGSIGKCLHVNGTLNYLSLNNCSLKDENISKLCEGLSKNVSLEKIRLCKNSITDIGTVFIADMLSKNKKLLSLDLGYNFIKNKGGIAIAQALRKNSTIEKLFFIENSMKDETGRMLAEVTRYKGNLLIVDLNMNPINLKYIKEIKDNLARNNSNYKTLLSPRLRVENEKLNMYDFEIEVIKEKIEDKIREKSDVQEKISKQTAKLRSTIEEEKEKYRLVKEEFIEAKTKNQNYSKTLENTVKEIAEVCYIGEKNIKDLQEAISLAAVEAIKLEKKKKQMKEDFGMKRSKLISEIETIGYYKKDAEIHRDSALSSIDICRSKIRNMIEEINMIKNPRKANEEIKKSQTRKKIRSRSSKPSARVISVAR